MDFKRTKFRIFKIQVDKIFAWTKEFKGQDFRCGSIVREGQILEAQTDVKEFQ